MLDEVNDLLEPKDGSGYNKEKLRVDSLTTAESSFKKNEVTSYLSKNLLSNIGNEH